MTFEKVKSDGKNTLVFAHDEAKVTPEQSDGLSLPDFYTFTAKGNREVALYRAQKLRLFYCMSCWSHLFSCNSGAYFAYYHGVFQVVSIFLARNLFIFLLFCHCSAETLSILSPF